MKDLGQLEKVNVSDEDKIRVSQLLDIASKTRIQRVWQDQKGYV